MRLSLTTHLRRDENNDLRLYLTPTLQADTSLNAHALIRQLDELHPNFAPSLMALIDCAHTLTPVFTPGTAYNTIIDLHWAGDETGEDALTDLRYELAQERGVTPNDVPLEEVKTLANEHFLTPETLEARLPRKYYEATHTHVEELLEYFSTGLFPGTLGDLQKLIHAAAAARTHSNSLQQHNLVDWDDEYLYESSAPWYTTMVSITDPTLTRGAHGSEFTDSVYEALYEYEQYLMHSDQEPGPSAAYLIPHTPEGLHQLAGLTQKIRHQLTLENCVYEHLARLTQATSETGRSNQ